MALTRCPECGKEVSDMAQSCPNCGRPLRMYQNRMQNQGNQGFNGPVQPQQNVVQAGKPKKKGPGCLTSIILLIFIFCGLCYIVSIGVKDMQENPEKYENKSVLAEALELDEEQETAMLAIFDQCGIGEITNVELIQSGEESSYYMADEEISHIVVWILNDKTVDSIYYHDHDIYVEGQVIAPITNYYVNSDLKNRYRTLSQEAIKSLLNYPDTAKFKGISKWKFGVEDDGTIVVQSSVTAQNAFGVEDTVDFQIIYDNYTPVSLILDNREYIQQ